jgi:RNA polymerase sigma factor (sigma-70 family)
MTNSNTIETMPASDAELVAASLVGNREAFSQIVARYQTLICSLIYSNTGNLCQSEDVAQETFITAWKQLATLREPAKLRSWLCGIARNLTWDALKKEGREPSHAAEPLENIHESPAAGPLPHDFTISREEQAILWRSLERIPETYREPLILFYRENQSIETVAGNLELSEDAVKQRLSRGRKLLQEQVLAFVEGALGKTVPGREFTLGVMGALPGMALSAKAAVLGAAAAKGSVAAKTAGIMGLCGAIISPVCTFAGMWIGYRISVDVARSDRERQFAIKFQKRLIGCMVIFAVPYIILLLCGGPLVKTNATLFVLLTAGLALGYVLACGYYSVWCYRERRKLLASMTPAELATRPQAPVWEYRSRFHLLGLPFIHFRIGDRMAEPIRAWIAAGDCALGVLFAFGGLAIAPVSIGGCAVGLFTFGGLSIGMLALGGMGLGIWTFGGLAFGWQAFGGCAIAWNAAWGGYAIAHDLALGGVVHALQINPATVHQLMESNLFFRVSEKVLPYLLWLNLMWVFPLLVQWRVIAAKRRAQAATETIKAPR